MAGQLLAVVKALQPNVLNGPDYCGPLDIDQSLCCVLRGNFLDINEKNEVEQLSIKQISVDDVLEKNS